MRLSHACVAWLVGSSASLVAVADVAILLPAADVTLYEASSAGEVSASGQGTWIFMGRTRQAELRRALVRYDIASQIPAGSTISSVRLAIEVDRSVTGGFPASLHRLIASWGEGASDAGGQGGIGGTPATGDATWFHRFFPDQLWSSQGGDYFETPSAVASIAGPSDYEWSSTPTLVQDVQSWLDLPVDNHGWILRGFEQGITASAKRMPSRESPDEGARPTLIVEFIPPGSMCGDIDMNNDGSFFDPQDIEAFVSIFSEGPCVPATATCGDIDFNNDGSVFDPCDIESFLLVFAEGPCTLCGQ